MACKYQQKRTHAMPEILSKLSTELYELVHSSVVTPQKCGLLASKTGLRKHNDVLLNPYVLAVSLIVEFLESGPHIGTPNSFNLEAIYKSYLNVAESLNELRTAGHRAKIKFLTKDGLMYYLKKPAFEEFSRLLFEEVFAFSHNQISASNMRKEGELLINSLNVYLNTPISDVIANDGCYKVVDGELCNDFKGARTAKKDSLNEDGSTKKAENSQLGIQVTYSCPNKSPINIAISSGVADEKKYVNVHNNELHIFDAGYYSAGLIDFFDKSNAYIVVRGRCNLVGCVNKVVIDGVDQSNKFGIGLSLKYNQALFPSLDKPVDMEITVEYKKEQANIKNCNVTAKRRIRAIRFEDEKSKGKPAYIITNLPWTVPTDTVLNIMRLRWSIELYFKELKSHTRYRAALTNSKSLTVGLVYFSMLTHSLRDSFLQKIERFTGITISRHKVVSTDVVVNGVWTSLSLTIGRLMAGRYCFYTSSLFDKTIKAVLKLFCNSHVKLETSLQSKKKQASHLHCKSSFNSSTSNYSESFWQRY